MTRLDVNEVLTTCGFSEKEIYQVKFEHQLVSGVVASTTERELAAKLAMLVHKPMEELKEIFLSSRLRQEADPAVTQIGWLNGDDDSLESLSQLKLEPSGAVLSDAYCSVKPGSSDLNLSSSEMQLFQSLASQDQAEMKLREILFERYKLYRQKGLNGILPYTRKGGKDFHPGEELKIKSELSPILNEHFPKFYEVINDYPNTKPEELEEDFSWVNFEIDNKPTIALVHKMGMPEADAYAFCQRHFYVSRGHNSLQGVGGAFPITSFEGSDDDPLNTLMVYVSRVSTDQVAGFGGAAKRAIGAKIMGGRIAENFERSRQVVEKSG